jgi:integrase
MPKVSKILTNKAVKSLAKTPKSGLYPVGGVTGLSLQIRHDDETGAHSASWILRIKIGENRRNIGLGGFKSISLAKVRDTAEKLRFKIKYEGLDPIKSRNETRIKAKENEAYLSKLKTFKQMAIEYIEKKGGEYKNPYREIQKITYQLETYAYPVIGEFLIKDIELSHIVEILKDIWKTKHETANRVRIHVGKVFDMAIAQDTYTKLNPTRWNGGLENFLVKPSKAHKVLNRESLPVERMPKLWDLLKSDPSQSSKALQFIILTSSRYKEVVKASWSEIDLKNKIWTKPEENTKNGKIHRIPLSNESIKLLKSMPKDYDLIFPNNKGLPLSNVAIAKAHRKHGYKGANNKPITTHGFRSTFKDWAATLTNYPDQLSEIQLHHSIGDKTREAYARDDLIDKRALLAEDWANYCAHGKQVGGDNVRAIGEAV